MLIAFSTERHQNGEREGYSDSSIEFERVGSVVTALPGRYVRWSLQVCVVVPCSLTYPHRAG